MGSIGIRKVSPAGPMKAMQSDSQYDNMPSLPSISKPDTNLNTTQLFKNAGKSRGSSRHASGQPGYSSTMISTEVNSNIQKNTSRIPNHGGAGNNHKLKRVNIL